MFLVDLILLRNMLKRGKLRVCKLGFDKLEVCYGTFSVGLSGLAMIAYELIFKMTQIDNGVFKLWGWSLLLLNYLSISC